MDALARFLELEKQGNIPDIDWTKRFRERELHPDDNIDIELNCLQVCQPQFDVDLFTLNNFSAIVGPAKSRKSFLVAMFIAAFARKGLSQNKFTTEIPGIAVLFDTEQGSKHLQQKIKSIDKLAGGYTNVKSYALRPDPPRERIAFIDEFLRVHSKHSKLIVIDGVRDLMNDINSTTESTEVSSKLMKWTYDYNIHIITIIHTNKEGGYARGHIGTEIMNKSETVIKVSKEGNLSRVICEYSRGIPFNDFYFSIEDGLPTITDNPDIDNQDNDVF